MTIPEVDFNREKEWWDAKAQQEETDQGDEFINRALRWREIEKHLSGVTSVLDVGGATGAFSIPLAKRGYKVTHLDFSPRMLEIARQNAHGVDGITFIEGNAADLSQFPNRSFNLVLNMDGAISFCGSKATEAILESCRVCKHKLILTVTNRTNMIPVWVSSSVAVTGKILQTVEAMVSRGEWDQRQFPENSLIAKGLTQDYFGSLKAFLPGEVRNILEAADMKVLRCGGIGSLALLCGRDTVSTILENNALTQTFLDYCDRYDKEVLPDGPGTRMRAGLIAVCEPVD